MRKRSEVLALLGAALLLLAAGCGDRDSDPTVRPDGGGDIRDTSGDSPSDNGTPDQGGPDEGTPDGTPDTPADIEFDVPPGTLTIFDIQDPGSLNRPAIGTEVTVRGIVTAIDRRRFEDNPTTYGSFFIQDPAGGAYSGIQVYNFNGLRVDIEGLLVGQTVDVTGAYSEYPPQLAGDDAATVSQIEARSMVVVNATPQPLTPATVSPAEVATGGAQAEAYEGVLVQVLDVTVTSNTIGYGKFVVTGGLEIDDELTAFPTFPPVGHTYARLAGVLTYTFDAVQLNPRDAGDIQGDIVVLDLTIYDIQDPDSPNHPERLGTTVTVTGVVTGIDTYVNNDNENNASNFWIQDPDGGRYSGVFVYTTRGNHYNPAPLQVGYTVRVTGATGENFNQTQIVVAQGGVEILDTTSSPLAPEVVDTADVTTGGAEQEAYEGVLIRVEDVTFVRQLTEADETGPSDRTNHFFIDDELIVANTFFSLPTPAATYSHIDGVLTWAFNRSRIAPRSPADLVE
jgi:predicted extracellular nuclease